jgi:hypothetical protein
MRVALSRSTDAYINYTDRPPAYRTSQHCHYSDHTLDIKMYILSASPIKMTSSIPLASRLLGTPLKPPPQNRLAHAKPQSSSSQAPRFPPPPHLRITSPHSTISATLRLHHEHTSQYHRPNRKLNERKPLARMASRFLLPAARRGVVPASRVAGVAARSFQTGRALRQEVVAPAPVRKPVGAFRGG